MLSTACINVQGLVKLLAVKKLCFVVNQFFVAFALFSGQFCRSSRIFWDLQGKISNQGCHFGYQRCNRAEMFLNNALAFLAQSMLFVVVLLLHTIQFLNPVRVKILTFSMSDKNMYIVCSCCGNLHFTDFYITINGLLYQRIAQQKYTYTKQKIKYHFCCYKNRHLYSILKYFQYLFTHLHIISATKLTTL